MGDEWTEAEGTVHSGVCYFFNVRLLLSNRPSRRKSKKSCHRKQIARLTLLSQTEARTEGEGNGRKMDETRFKEEGKGWKRRELEMG